MVAPAVDATLASPPASQAPAGVQNGWPRQGGVMAFYGGVGLNQTAIDLPYPMKLA